MESATAPPQPPELPEGVDPAPVWPAWYAPLAFLVGVVGTFVAVAIVAAVTGVTDPDEATPTFTILATLGQSIVFVVTSVLFASLQQPPRPWQFGLRGTRLWPAVGWAALGMLSFYVFAAIYSVAVQPDIEQNITKELGAEDSTVGLVVAGFMVIAVAPVGEEFFFRGFFYRALRSRYAIPLAAAIDGLLFGVIHWDFSKLDGLLIVPPLAVLGLVFCLVYEKTGSLYPVIGLHAFNNSLAFGAQADGWAVSAVFLPLVLVGCALVPKLTGGAPRALPALR